jgi:anti-anti-sigma regulatory factor
MKITGLLTIETVGANRTAILSALSQSAFCLDLSEVSGVDAAGIQLLVSLMKECDSRGIDLSFAGTLTSSVQQRLRESGFLDDLSATAQGLLLKLRDLK